MGRGLYPGVRNDRPGVNETREEARRRWSDEYIQRWLPSKNKPKHRMSIPPGCVDVYRVHQWDGKRNTFHGVYRDEADAYKKADELWLAKHRGDKFYVDHKAAIELDGRFYLVNLAPVTFTPPAELEVPEHMMEEEEHEG